MYTAVDILSLGVHAWRGSKTKVELWVVPQSERVDDATKAIEVRTARRITESHRAATWRTKMTFIDGIGRT